MLPSPEVEWALPKLITEEGFSPSGRTLVNSPSRPSRLVTSVSSLSSRSRSVLLSKLALSFSSSFTVRMSPISLARVSLKKALAPWRHSEFGLWSAAIGAGMGMLTGWYFGDAVGLEIWLSAGPSPTSERRVRVLHPATANARAAAIRMRVAEVILSRFMTACS